MDLMKNRRKISGIVVNSKALLRFSVPFVVMIVGSVAAILLLHWQMMEALLQIEDSSPQASIAITKAIETVTNTGMIGMLILGSACLAFWIIYSHRIFGPIVPFRRHVQSLLNGDFQSRITLRKRDEFKELAEDLNRLAEKLGAKS